MDTILGHVCDVVNGSLDTQQHQYYTFDKSLGKSVVDGMRDATDELAQTAAHLTTTLMRAHADNDPLQEAVIALSARVSDYGSLLQSASGKILICFFYIIR